MSQAAKINKNTNKTKFWLVYMTEDYFLLKYYPIQMLLVDN